MNTLKRAIATFFFTGYSPVAPGTCASVLSAGIYVAVAYAFPCHTGAIVGAFIIVALGANLWTGRWAQNAFGGSDPQKMVVDECLGYFAATFLVSGPEPWLTALLALGLFRLFDIAKPYPIRRLEKLPGAWGLAMDDLAAGICANVVLQAGLMFYRFART